MAYNAAIAIRRPQPGATPSTSPRLTPAAAAALKTNELTAGAPTLSAASAPFVFGSTAATPLASVAYAPDAGGSGAGSMAMGVGAQEFVPRRVETPALSEDSPFFSPEGQAAELLQMHPSNGYGQPSRQVSELGEYFEQAMDMNGEYAMQQGQMGHQLQEQQPHLSEGGLYSYNQPPGPGSNYYPDQPQQFARQPLQYHHYHPSPSHSLLPSQSFFLSPSLHINLTSKSEATHATYSGDLKLPEEVGGYEGLMPLDKAGEQDGPGSLGGYRSWIYKAWKSDGRAYALKRVEGFRLQHESAISVVEKWTRVRHPGLVSVREAFTTRAFGDHSIIFVYDFHACSSTLYEAHLSPLSSLPPNPWNQPNASHHLHSQQYAGAHRSRQQAHLPNSTGGGVPERLLWSYIVQIGSAVKAVHNAGLAVRNLEVSKVIVTGTNRIRIGGCGVLDVLGWEGGGQGAFQQDDLLSFGKLVIMLACGSTASVHNLPKSVDHISRVYSGDLKNVILYLLSKPGPRKTIEEALALMGGRVLDELNASFAAEDTLEAELMRELENARLVRLLTKFGFINERPEFDHDPRWAETGDRYIIKLFRDFVFHQVDENGRPVTDLSHVLTCLNKLDAGVDEKIMLVSRDEQSCLIVSYREREAREASYAPPPSPLAALLPRTMSRDPAPPRSPRHHPASHPSERSSHSRPPKSSPSPGSFPPPSAHTFDLSNYLQSTFIPSVVPSAAEYEAKESARQFLEGLAERVSPGAKLLPFGSMANGFALKNSDMDLCCFMGPESPVRTPAELVETLGRLIQSETNFHVKMLSRARIPIIKLTMPPTATVPFGMACDIGFENRLALENTRLLLTYAMVDPRLRTLVLFLKVWTKRRKINNPYRGTLSSYGYVLLVIHFLTHVISPPVLPNLQRLPLPRALPLEDLEYEGHDISFYDDLEALPRVWQTNNQENVGQLLVEFFRYFSKDFMYNSDVVSIRSATGIVGKDVKGWFTDVEYDPDTIVRDLHKLCIEDPFQLDYNVARTVTRDGLYTIRGEFMRAHRVLGLRTSDRASALITGVCEEREDFLIPHPPVERHHDTIRRRSAPSPRMQPTGMGAPPLPNSMNDFRIWAALNGVNDAAGLGMGLGDGKGGIVGVGPGRGGTGRAGEETWDPLSPRLMDEGSHSTGQQRTHHSLPRRPTHASFGPTPSQPSLERRISWDGAASNTTAQSSYDLHRSFQNQPSTTPSSPDLGARLYHGGGYSAPIRYHQFPIQRSNQEMNNNHSYYAPAPIFPEADREIVAMANSITFGSFPSQHPHAYPYASSSSSSAYGGTNTSPSNSYHAFNLEDNAGESNGRGREVRDGDGYVDAAGRPRGRSVPHVRIGSEGRDSTILFGEISVTLPRSRERSVREERGEEVREEEHEEEHEEQEEQGRGEPISSIPTFTTSPPTPVKTQMKRQARDPKSSTSSSPAPSSPSSSPLMTSLDDDSSSPLLNGSPKLIPTPSIISTSPQMSFAGAVRSPSLSSEARLENGIAKLSLSEVSKGPGPGKGSRKGSKGGGGSPAGIQE